MLFETKRVIVGILVEQVNFCLGKTNYITVLEFTQNSGQCPPHYRQCVGGEEPFYPLISTLSPDLNSTVKWSAKTVIFSMSFLIISSSNSVMSVS